jgi:drug/metabolite transporter (DMT)-like permease
MLVLIIVGILNASVLWLYLQALEQEEASVVVVFYQLVPLIGLVLGFLILGETISKLQFIAMSIIILGTTIISFEIDNENNFKLKKRTVALMLGASTFWALESVIFKYAALEVNLWRSLFWEHLVLLVIGLLIFIFVKKYRDNFLLAMNTNSSKILQLNGLNEVVYMLGNFATSFAYLLAPVALILLTQSFQPIFVFAIGIFLTVFFPKVSVENIHTKNLWQKVFSIIITGIGTYLLLM